MRLKLYDKWNNYQALTCQVMRSWIKICLTSASLSVYTFKSHEIDVSVSKHVLLKIEQSIGPYYPIGSNPWFCIFSVSLLKTTLLTAIYRYNWIHHLSITHLCPTLWPFCNDKLSKNADNKGAANDMSDGLPNYFFYCGAKKSQWC